MNRIVQFPSSSGNAHSSQFSGRRLLREIGVLNSAGRILYDRRGGKAKLFAKSASSLVSVVRPANSRLVTLKDAVASTSHRVMNVDASMDAMSNGMTILILNDKGLIQHCNRFGVLLLGWQPSSLLFQHVSTVLPQLEETHLISDGQISPRLRFLVRMGHRFEVVGQHGVCFKCKLFLNLKEYQGQDYLQMILRPV